MENSKYTAKDIYVLKGLDPVRKRPGMYIGSTGLDGLLHLIWECINNCLDEAMMGYADNIEVTLLPENRVKISDNGRGIPVDKHAITKKSALETIMTTLHAGGKFGGDVYKVSGGLHGVGVSVVCALSKYMRVEISRDGGTFSQEYSQGKIKTPVKKLGASRKTGTTIIFEPDVEIFKEIKFDEKKILKYLRQQAYLTKGVKISFKDEREKKYAKYSFYFEGGIASYVKYLTKDVVPRHDSVFYCSGESNEIFIEAALRYTDEYECYEESFANNIYTVDGGTHLTGFRSALTRTFNDYARKNDIIKKTEDNFSGEDIREGLTSVVSIKIKEPQFEGQTKAKLGNTEAKSAVDQIVSEHLIDFLERNPQDAKNIIKKCILSLKARKAARVAKDTVLRKGIMDGLSLPGKLADCSSKKPEESELFLVEGDSAGGCFSKETEVALVGGRNLSFEGLVEEDKQGRKNYCYTIKEDGSVGIGLIENPRKTKINTKVIKVTLDNNEEIICTPDHKFMLKDGTYKVAQKLTENDSLMPLYKKHSEKKGETTTEGGEMVFDSLKMKWIFTHLLSDNYNLENDAYLREGDHIDFNKLNHCEGVKEKSRETRRAELKFMREIFERDGKLDKKKYDRERSMTKNKNLLKYETVSQRFFTGNEEKLKDLVLNYNHKIKKIVSLKKKIDVYDLEVANTHNFALASGVFVHNSCKLARDRKFQAILPLRGKILNVERARLDKILASKEIRALIIALGTAVGEDFNLDKIRYHKIILTLDADVDGSHIRTLLLTLFFRYFKPIIEKGYLYIAQPPLYKIQAGKEIHYAYTEKGKEEILKKIKQSNFSIQRYKGLGEMNPSQLWETTMNPDNRILSQVTMEDAKEADRVFDMLMGDDVSLRKKFIQTYASEVKNLDI